MPWANNVKLQLKGDFRFRFLENGPYHEHA